MRFGCPPGSHSWEFILQVLKYLGMFQDHDPPSAAKFSHVALAQKRTFAQVLHNACSIPLSHLPFCIKGDMVSVQISEEIYLV